MSRRATVPPVRVVSLVPSITETLLDWGVVPVACTRFCEQPDLAHVGGTKDPDIEAIVALAPDLVVMDEEENRRDDALALGRHGIVVHATSVRSVDDVAPALASLRAALGLGPLAPDRAAVPGASVDRRGGAAGPRRTVFVPIWRRPWMTLNGDTYASSLLARLGLDGAFADAPDRYPETTLAEVARRSPDLVLLPSEPYPFAERHVAEVAAALPAADIRLVDGRDLFWWGTRTPGAIGRLAAATRPADQA